MISRPRDANTLRDIVECVQERRPSSVISGNARAQQKGAQTENVSFWFLKPRDKIKAHVKRCKKRQQYIRDRKQGRQMSNLKGFAVGKITARPLS